MPSPCKRGFVLGIWLLVLCMASASGRASVAQPSATSNVAPPPGAAAAARNVQDPHTTGTARPPIRSNAAPLTSDECTKLGGAVTQDVYHLCMSGKYCVTTDENGATHVACIRDK
jgi:hypothetical protein